MRRDASWPTFWAERVALHLPVVAGLFSNLKAGSDQIGKLEAWASVENRVQEHGNKKGSEEEIVKRTAIHHAYYASQTTEPLCEATKHHWANGDFVSFSLTGRLIFEYAASINYALKLLREATNSGDWKTALEKYEPLVTGTRRPIGFRFTRCLSRKV